MLPHCNNYYVLRINISDITVKRTSEVTEKLLPHKTGSAALYGNIYVHKMLLYCKIIFVGYTTQIALHVI
jgi:hypothetical protein